jgi:hypothetical protein
MSLLATSTAIAVISWAIMVISAFVYSVSESWVFSLISVISGLSFIISVAVTAIAAILAFL